ncbi:hypothetical protein T440DRAFT_484567 [Plenodomus tracheiphilus IPT5]|uniref:Uncharacterized protein n=1 Tax=Plenodomus tracheiphilus IPT5 TaxID=1408161 RepID=A0A6A7ANZ6_9PLEO|nr:hypothetical protein T440DRAFT_484567 [Plenodomus tracheiphilus IPT5]
MSSQQREQSLARAKARAKAKAQTDNYNKLCEEYNTKLHYLSYRNGRYRGYNSLDESGQPWTPPTQRELVGLLFLSRCSQQYTDFQDDMYPAPKISSPSTPPVSERPPDDVEKTSTSPRTHVAPA